MSAYSRLSILTIFVISIFSSILYPRLPHSMASHWNMRGQVDGYVSREIGAFFLPFTTLFAFTLITFISNNDPSIQKKAKLKNSLQSIAFEIVILLSYIHVLTLAWNLGIIFPMGKAILIGFTFLLYGMGKAFKSLESNYIVGIRTPWTLHTATIWGATHRLAAIIWQGGALAVLLGLFLPRGFSFYWLLAIMIGIVLIPTAYSFLLFQQKND